MDYWKGAMNAPIDESWRCETCGADRSWLIWGMVNGECRCERCHHEYTMRDGNKYVMTPINMVKEDFRAAARLGWQEKHTPMDEWTDSYWKKLKEACKQ